MSSARPERAGSASGVNETLVEASGALGHRGARQRARGDGELRVAAPGGGRGRAGGRDRRRVGVPGVAVGRHEPVVDRRTRRRLEVVGRADPRSTRARSPRTRRRRSPSRPARPRTRRAGLGPNSSGSSALRLHAPPPRAAAGAGARRATGTPTACRFEVGHTSSTTSSSARRFTSSGSSIDRTPCWRRSAPSVVERDPYRLGPGELAACGVDSSPRLLGDGERLGVGPGGPTASSLARPNATTPWSRASPRGGPAPPPPRARRCGRRRASDRCRRRGARRRRAARRAPSRRSSSSSPNRLRWCGA